jgi:PleD family two-component response regulator
LNSISFTILDSTAQPPSVTRQISDLASPLSGPSSATDTPTSATHDFAPTSTLKDTLSPETPLSPPKTPVAEPPTTDKETEGANGTTEPAPPVEENTEEKAGENRGLRVLLVEDNEINLKLLIATMRKLKLDHATATNGLEAFNSYKERQGKFDVVFMGTYPPSRLP